MKTENAMRLTAQVGAKALRNADKYFTGDIKPIAIEMLQNARRAGASKVDVTVTDGGTITFADDGRGLAREDAGVLLTFGGSANAADVEFREDPAGMGFFCLAGRRVEVRSRDWTMVIPPRAMTGEEDALLTSSEPVDGMTVSFESAESAHDAIGKVKAAAKHMPLVVTINGETVETVPFARYLGEEGPGRTCLTRKVHGCQIHIVRWDEWRHAPVKRADDGPDMIVDMFGQIFEADLQRSTGRDYLPNLQHQNGAYALEDAVPMEDGSSHVFSRNRSHWRVAISIGEASVLSPRLPARDAIVINDGWRAIAGEIESMMVELAMALPFNGISKDSPLRAIAKRLGRTIPPNRIIVSTASYTTNYGDFGDPVIRTRPVEIRDGERVVWRAADAPDPSQCLIWRNDDASADVALAFALRDNPGSMLSFIAPFGTDEEHKAAGYADCDRLSVKASLKNGRTKVATIDKVEGSFIDFAYEMNELADALSKDANGIVATSISISATSSQDPSRRTSLNMKALAWVGEDDFYTDARFFATDDASVDHVVEMLMHAYSWYASGGSDTDSYETQEEQALSDFTDLVEPYLLGKEAALVNAIEAAMGSLLRSVEDGLLKQVTLKPISADGDGRRTAHRLTVTTSDGKRHTRVLR